MLYVFLDESGDFDFSINGSRYFIVTALSVIRPFDAVFPLEELKYDLWESGLRIESFHASEDRQFVRDKVFNIISQKMTDYRVDSIIVEKCKTFPALQSDTARFYKTIFGILLKYVLVKSSQKHSDVTFVTDSIPLKKKRNQIEKALNQELTDWSRKSQGTYQIFHFPSKSDINLQIVDYIGWAIFRNWSRGDTRSYNLISKCIKTEFDVFKVSKEKFY